MKDEIENNQEAVTSRKRGRPPKTGETRSKSEAPAVEKALDILELLSASPHGLSMNEMTKVLGRTVGEIYRVVVYLSKREYIVQDEETDRYALTLKLFELSHQHNPTERLIKLAVPILEKLAFQVEQSCHLTLLNQNNVLVLASVPSPRPAGYSVRTGAIFPIMDTSSGIVILSYTSDVQQSRFLAGLSEPDQEELRQRIGDIRAKGYEKQKSALVNGVLNMSAPVFNKSGITAAITMGYITQVNQRCGPEEALVAVVQAGKELSALLGGKVPHFS